MNFLSKYDQYIFDLDGVVYLDDKETIGASETLKKLRKHNKKVCFVTNNPTRSPKEYKNKLASFNIHSDVDEIISSPMALKYYLESKYGMESNKSAYIIGSSYLKDEIKKTGIKSLAVKDVHRADLVLMGGHKKFNYEEIKNATIAIRNGATLIATNKDYYYPSGKGFLPATGSLLISIEKASGRKAVIVGKPEKYIFQLLKSSFIKNVNTTLFIGDSLETDIRGAKKAGIRTALTLTGNTSKGMLIKSKTKPDYVINDLRELFN